MQPLRADEEQAGGIIHKPMFERLLLCDFVVCDLTFANANVFYELGIRHAARPATTVLIKASSVRLPFDVAMLRTLSYSLDTSGNPSNEGKDSTTLTRTLENCRKTRAKDSPLFQLLDGIEPLTVSSDKTDVFREQVEYAEEIRNNLAKARENGKKAVDEVLHSLGAIDSIETGVIIDLMLSYRAVNGWENMIDLITNLPEHVRRTVMVQEQFGLALNRAGKRREAENVLKDLIKQRGPSSETLGILGRVYKDRWEDAEKARNTPLANTLLKKAAETYLSGFESDWRDHYPGINAITLMEVQNPPDPEREKLFPLVMYSVERRIAGGDPDYWDWATLLELQVLGNDENAANKALGQALASAREPFEPETTQRNLRLIREARERRGEYVAWIEKIEAQLNELMVCDLSES